MLEVRIGPNAKRIFDEVVLSRIINNFDKPVAHLSQPVQFVYSTRSMDTHFGEGLYDTDYKKHTTSRNCLVPVPEDASEDSIKEELSKYKSHIYCVISNKPSDIISETDKFRLENFEVEEQDLLDKYETQDSEGNRYSFGLKRVTLDGEVLNDNLPEYRRYVYSRSYFPDIDLRDMSVKLKARSNVYNYNLEV